MILEYVNIMQHRLYIATVIVSSVALFVGCNSGESFSDHPDSTGSDSTVVEESYGALSAEVVGGDDAEVKLQAQFLDARGVDVQSALDALEAGVPLRGLQQEDCRFVDAEAQPGAQHDPASLHLMDIGTIEVETSQQSVEVQPRDLPDLLNAFHGVVYGSEWSEEETEATVDYRPGEPYRFSAAGTTTLGGFEMVMTAPQPVVLVAANGEEIGEEAVLQVDRREDLELVWETSGSEKGEVFVELRAGAGPNADRLQCRSGDVGAFTVPASMLDQFSETAALELRRIHRSDVEVEGLDEMEVFFGSTDRVDLEFL